MLKNKGTSFINHLLEEKKRKNPRYSLKALGRDVGVSQPQLTKILSGQCRMSPHVAYRLGLHANLNDSQLLDLLRFTLEGETELEDKV